MNQSNRTSHLAYEPLENYPGPAQLPPVLKATQYRAQLTRRHHRLFDMSGIHSFIQRMKDDPNMLDHLMRTEDIRWSPFSFLTLSASAVLTDSTTTDPIERTAKLIIAARTFFNDLQSGRLMPDMYQNHPLEMGQYMNLFSTGISPRGTASRVHKSTDFTSIVVLAAGKCYRLDLFTNNEMPTLEQTTEVLHKVVQDAGNTPPEAIGSISALNMPRRIAVNRYLLRSADNPVAFKTMQRAFLVVCMDLDHSPDTLQTTAQLLHSGNFTNRWYYAGCQLVAFGNARAGLIFSFPCGLDGNVMARFSQDIYQRSEALKSPSRSRMGSPKPVHTPIHFARIRWSIPKRLLFHTQHVAQKTIRTDPDLFQIPVGRQALSRMNMRPDALFNISLLSALFALTGRTVNIREHATMSRYRNMGLTLANVTTEEAIRFMSLLNSNAKRESLIAALKAASSAHMERLRFARSHLPLRMLALLHFRSAPVYQKPAAWLLSALLGGRPDIIVSSPRIVPEVMLLGRPGIRLPYVKYGALHYAIYPDRCQIVFMPPNHSVFPNKALVKMLHKYLYKMEELLTEHTNNPPF